MIRTTLDLLSTLFPALLRLPDLELVASTSYEDALRKLGLRSPVGSILRSAEWSRVPVALRERAFFSATIEDARWLQQRMNFLQDTLANTTATNERGERYFKAGGRARFIEEAQRDAIRSGLRSTTDPNEIGGLQDIRSATRLGLIYDVNLRAAQDYGYWKQGMDPDVLAAFPAQRFIRVQAVRKPRPLHQANREVVRRKDDLDFWLAMNDEAIGGFGVPWGPWGFNSGMDVEDVGREESDALGLTRPNEIIRPVEKDFNDRLQASAQGLSAPLINLLKIAFGDRVTFAGGTVRWASGSGMPAAPAPNNAPTPPSPPAAPPPRTTLPAGAPVSSAAQINAATKKEAAKFQATLDVIDSVHGDGALASIPIESTKSTAFLGAYLSRPNDAVAIKIRRSLADTEFTLTHEVGHWLDHIGIPSSTRFASQGAPEMADWVRAVQSTAAYQQIVSDATISPWMRQYLLRPQELWARSYAQFIAEESGSVSIQAGVDKVLAGAHAGFPTSAQWMPADFAPVRTAIRDLFLKLGWLNPSPPAP